MSAASPVRLIRNEFELRDLVDSMGRDSSLIERDFALMTIAAGLVADYGEELCYSGPLGEGFVSVEVSYREDVIEGPEMVAIGPPYYEPFLVPVMRLVEIVAEKLRALAARKFELVKQGNRRARIEETIAGMEGQYDGVVAAVAPDAPDYETAATVVLGRLTALLP
jgi:hypothetical protein